MTDQLEALRSMGFRLTVQIDFPRGTKVWATHLLTGNCVKAHESSVDRALQSVIDQHYALQAQDDFEGML